MTLAEYKKNYQPVPKQTTLVFLRREGEILLAMKKRGFGAGRWNGPGGKVEAGETIEAAAKREVHEEIGVRVGHLAQVASLHFYFVPEAGDAEYIECTVYATTSWEGEPAESEEMAPRWYNEADIPYSEMWPDDMYWLPGVLEGKILHAEFIFDRSDNVLDMDVREG